MSNRIDLPADASQSNEPLTVSPVSPGPDRSRRRCGKIARLPKEVRQELNTRLEDGQSYDEIIHWLTSNGHDGFTISRT